MRIDIVMPVLDDWESASCVIRQLDQIFASTDNTVNILLVDDGSTLSPPKELGETKYLRLREILVLELKKNVGSQRAIAIGLCHLAKRPECDATLVMDGDGEDEPTDALRLVETLKQCKAPAVIFAERMRRSESLGFRVGYWIYRQLHVVLTGRSIRVGNFSLIPALYLRKIVTEPMLWNHYAASIMRDRLPIELIPTHRGKRIKGQSRLDYTSLVVHGLSALACYSERIGVRLIFCSGGVLLCAIAGLAALLWVRLFTSLAVPGWTSLLLCLITIIIMQIVSLAATFTMQIISLRSSQPFLPMRDYIWFIAQENVLYRSAT